MTTHPTAWELWQAQFTDGDEIIVLDEDERIWRGPHKATHDHLIVNPGKIREVRLDWEDVAFVAHDGFPARKLMGADGSHTAELIDTTETTAALRQFFYMVNVMVDESKSEKARKAAEAAERARREETAAYIEQSRKRGIFSAGFSDPWWIEGVEGVLHFAGNDGPEHWVEDDEEVLVMRACDGARAMLWSVRTVFCIET